MTDAPERIWAKEGHDAWFAWGHWYRDNKGGGVEYVRADLATRATDSAGLLQTLDDIAGYAAMDPRSSFDTLIIDLVNLAKARAAK